MARPKRMGAYNALDDLLPGPAWDLSAEPADEPAPPPRRPRLQPVPDPPARRGRGSNALDELLPGPGAGDGLDDLLPGPSAPSARRVGTAPRALGDRGGRHLGVWNPLDGPPPPPAPPLPAPPPVPAKVRVSFRLPTDLVETARDAVAHLAGTADRTNLTALTERALRVELARLAITHNHGQPFTPRDS
jgi:hypothetical protein